MVVALLNKALMEGVPLQIIRDGHERRAVNGVKCSFISLSVLALPWADGKYPMDTDSLDARIGCDIIQKENSSVLKLVAY